MTTPNRLDDVDRLLADRWDEVANLIAARDALIDKLRSALEAAGERVRDWGKENDWFVYVDAKKGDINVARKSWTSNGDESCSHIINLVMEGLTPAAVFGGGTRPYSGVYSRGLKKIGLGNQRDEFAALMLKSAGKDSKAWPEAEAGRYPAYRYLPAANRSLRDLVFEPDFAHV